MRTTYNTYKPTNADAGYDCPKGGTVTSRGVNMS